MEGSFGNNSLSQAVDIFQNKAAPSAHKAFWWAPGGPDGPAQAPAVGGAPQTSFAVLNKCHTREGAENEAWQEFCLWVHLYICIPEPWPFHDLQVWEKAVVFRCCLRYLSAISVAVAASEVLIAESLPLWLSCCLPLLPATQHQHRYFQEMHFAKCLSEKTTYWEGVGATNTSE